MMYRILQVLSLSISFPIGFWFLKPWAAALLACVTRLSPIVAAQGVQALWHPTDLVACLRLRPRTLVHGTRVDKALGLWIAIEPMVYISLAIVLSEGTDGDLANAKAKETWERMLGERGQGFLLMFIMPLSAIWPSLAFLSFTLYLLFGPYSVGAYCLILGALFGLDFAGRDHVGGELPAQLHEHLPPNPALVCGLGVAFAASAALAGALLARQVIPNIPERRDDLTFLQRRLEDVAASRLMHYVRMKAPSSQSEEAFVRLLEDGVEGRLTFPEGFQPDVAVSAPLPKSLVTRLAPSVSFRSGLPGGLALPVALMVLDTLTDVNASVRLIIRGHYWFGGILAAIAYSSVVSQIAKGLLGAIPTALRESVAAGVPTRAYVDLLESESSFEAIPGFLVQLYSLPWSGLDSVVGIASAAFSVLLSVYSIATCVVNLVDFELDDLFEEAPGSGGEEAAQCRTLQCVQHTCW